MQNKCAIFVFGLETNLFGGGGERDIFDLYPILNSYRTIPTLYFLLPMVHSGKDLNSMVDDTMGVCWKQTKNIQGKTQKNLVP